MTLAAARITLRLHRFEVLAFGGLALLGVALTWLVAGRLDALGFSGTCIDAMRDGETPAGCEFKINAFYEMVGREAGPVNAITVFAPFLGGLLLGVPVVARELERGTTRLAWALAPSRMTWLAQRVVPVLVFVAAVGLVSGAAADRLLASTEPGIDPANAFAQFGFRGPILSARGVFIFSLATLVGAIMGRALPAVIVGGLIALVGIVGGAHVHQQMIRAEAVVVDGHSRGDWFFDQRFRLPNGDLVGWDEVERYDPPPTDPNSTEVWPTLPEVTIGVPGARYGEVQRRELAALGSASLLALAGTAFVVQRRRPG